MIIFIYGLLNQAFILRRQVAPDQNMTRVRNERSKNNRGGMQILRYKSNKTAFMSSPTACPTGHGSNWFARGRVLLGPRRFGELRLRKVFAPAKNFAETSAIPVLLAPLYVCCVLCRISHLRLKGNLKRPRR